jgi:hypothetical protein
MSKHTCWAYGSGPNDCPNASWVSCSGPRYGDDGGVKPVRKTAPVLSGGKLKVNMASSKLNGAGC